MVNPTAINTHAIRHSTSTQEMWGNDVNAPGTGEFDFLNYLLGLQVAPTDVASDLNVLSLKAGEETQNQDESVLSLFDKKGSELLNTMYPATSQMTDTKTAKPILVPGSEILTENGPGDVKEDRSIQKTTSLYDFEKRMLLESNSKTDVQPDKGAEALKMQKGETTSSDKTIGSGYDKMQKSALEAQKSTQDSNATANSKELGENDKNISNVIHHNAFTKETDELSGKDRKHSKEDEVDLLSSMDGSPSVPVGIQKDLGVDKHSPLQKPATVPEMFSKVQSMVHNGGGKMTITLNPPSLGQVEVQVTTKGKNVEIEMKSSNDFAKAALESHVAELKASMQSQDLVLQKLDVHVNSDLGRNLLGGQFSQNQQGGNLYQQNQSSFREFQSGAKSSFGNSNNSSSVTQVSTRPEWKPVSSGTGRVDIRV